jgi:hypothetical protein
VAGAAFASRIERELALVLVTMAVNAAGAGSVEDRSPGRAARTRRVTRATRRLPMRTLEHEGDPLVVEFNFGPRHLAVTRDAVDLDLGHREREGVGIRMARFAFGITEGEA